MCIGVRRAAVVALTAVFLFTAPAFALPNGATRIADFNTPAAGASTNYNGFPGAPSISNGVVIYRSAWGTASGLDRWAGGLRTNLLQTATAQPDTNDPFAGFAAHAASGGSIGFTGFGPQVKGVYGIVNDALVIFGDSTLPASPTTPSFVEFGAVSLDGDTAAFVAEIENQFGVRSRGIYRSSSKATPGNIIVGQTTLTPGSSRVFAWFGDTPVMRGVNTLFNGGDSVEREGLYIRGATNLRVFVDNTTDVVNSTANVKNIRGNFAFDGENAAFIGEGLFSVAGVYAAQEGSATLVASLFNGLPGGTGTFFGFQDVSLWEDRVVFTAFGAQGQQGIYGLINGELLRIFDLNTTIETGKQVQQYVIGREAIEGDLLTFRADFTDGSSGLYLYDLTAIPAPSGAAILVLSALSGLRRRR